MATERIITQDIFNQMMETAEPQEVTKYVDIYSITGKRNVLTTVNGMGKDEMVESIFQMFLQAADQLGTTVDQIRFTGSRTHSGFESVRLENAAELYERVQRQAENKAYRLREAKKTNARLAKRKQQEIERLEKELAKLKGQ